MTAEISIAALVGLNLWQFWFWGSHTSKLIDKLMCRNYAEYKQVEQSVNSSNHRTQHAKDLIKDDEVLRELNGMMGLGGNERI